MYSTYHIHIRTISRPAEGHTPLELREQHAARPPAVQPPGNGFRYCAPLRRSGACPFKAGPAPPREPSAPRRPQVRSGRGSPAAPPGTVPGGAGRGTGGATGLGPGTAALLSRWGGRRGVRPLPGQARGGGGADGWQLGRGQAVAPPGAHPLSVPSRRQVQARRDSAPTLSPSVPAPWP